MISLEELFFLIAGLEGAPFRDALQTPHSGLLQSSAGKHNPSPLRASVFLCKVGTLGQVNGFHLVSIKSSEEAPRFKMGNGKSVTSEVG